MRVFWDFSSLCAHATRYEFLAENVSLTNVVCAQAKFSITGAAAVTHGLMVAHDLDFLQLTRTGKYVAG